MVKVNFVPVSQAIVTNTGTKSISSIGSTVARGAGCQISSWQEVLDLELFCLFISIAHLFVYLFATGVVYKICHGLLRSRKLCQFLDILKLAIS